MADLFRQIYMFVWWLTCHFIN